MKPGARILVTGGAGFIGSHTVERLLDDGHEVTVLDDFSAGRRDNLPGHPRLHVQDGDVRDASSVAQAMTGAEACLHLAAQVSVQRSIAAPALSAQVNIVGFINVLEAARAAGVRRLVYASSAAVYGQPLGMPVAEEQPAAPISPYGVEKLVDEWYAAQYARLHGLSLLGLRYFNVYGPRQDPASPYAGVISRFVECARSGVAPQVRGDGKQTRDFIYVADVAALNLRALQSDATGTCNVGTGQARSLLDLLDVIARVGGWQVRPEFTAAQAGDIRNSCASTARMRAALGDPPLRDLEAGLREMLP